MKPLRHPRSLLEAFPADHWQNVITHYRRPKAERIADALMAVVMGLCAAVILVHFIAR